jgi:hypothetical protein
MSRRNQILSALGIVSLLAALYFGKTEQPKRAMRFSRTPVAASRPPAADLVVSPIITLPIAEAAATLNSADTLPADDLSTLDLLFTEFRKNHGGNPVGENEEITAVLLGGNLKHLSYLPASGRFLDGTGKLIDRWGTPYVFHSLTASRTEIRSAGPDRALWTSDDVTLTP